MRFFSGILVQIGAQTVDAAAEEQEVFRKFAFEAGIRRMQARWRLSTISHGPL
jgi:hypothetical protein